MLSNQLWIKLAPEMLIEWEQCHLEGRDVDRYRPLCAEIAAHGDEALAAQMADILASAPQRADFPYREPSDYQGIQNEKPPSAKLPTVTRDPAQLKDRIAGAWMGRIAGCLLGKPVEGYKKEALTTLLCETDNYPLRGYISDFNDKLVDGAAPVDDDTNYSVFALKLLEQYGRDFGPDDVLEAWLNWIPYLQTCTAERVAYRNAAAGLSAPRTATAGNPYREWIGAQIRGDFFGYIHIGDPHAAAEMAWRDASISHIKNGIYGEMFAAALIAAAAVCQDVSEAITAALCEIPQNCRLRRDIDMVMEWYQNGDTSDTVIEKIHRAYDEHSPMGWCHTNSNAMIVVMALLYGAKDLGRTICLAVQAAFDTDCNGATAGSVIGIMIGAEAIDPYWPAAYHYRLRTSIDGYNLMTLDELTEKTFAFVAADVIR